jgi:ABC-type polysaccharide/polyol phosphate transport system ATPase subunit
MSLIRKMCNAVVLLEAGQATFYSDIDQGIAAYEATGEAQ